MAVTIKRERPDQRRHHRLTAPLFVKVLGHRVRAADWSLGGLRLEGFPGDLPCIGAILELDLALPFQGFDVAFKVAAQVVRKDLEHGMFAVRFIEVGERESELMAHFVEELVRGHMGDVDDTIQRIDVPVTPSSLKPDRPSKAPGGANAETHEPGVKRRTVDLWPLRRLVITAFYILLGFLVVTYSGIIAYANFFRMEVSTAVITAPVETVEAQTDGRVVRTGFEPGDLVRSGDVLLNLIDGKLEHQIELAGIEVQELKAKLAYLKRRHADELERGKGFASIETKNVEQARLSLEATDASLTIAHDQHARLKTLYDKGFTTASSLDEARDRVTTLQKQLHRQRLELATRLGLAERNLGKRLYTGDDLIGNSTELEAEIRLAENTIALAQERYRANLKLRDSLAVRAPFDGTVMKLPRYDHATVRRGDVIAIIEQRRDRQVTAFLTQDEVAKVGLGDEALLFIPALGETLMGRVAIVDRTSGFVRQQEQRANPGYAWRGPDDRSAQVAITFDDDKVLRDWKRYRSGLPVVVNFERRTQNSFLSRLAEKLAL